MPIYRFTLLFVFAAIGLCSEAGRAYDWNNLSEKEIEEVKALRLQFFAEHTRGRGEAIAENQGAGLRLDGNQADFDVKHYAIDLDLNFATSTIDASVACRVRSLVAALTAIDLNLRNELTVDSVQVAGVNVAFTHIDHLLSIALPAPVGLDQLVTAVVFYHGTPYYDGAAGMDFTSEFGTQLCWTKATPFRARYWWPCKDFPEDKADSLDLHIECPDIYDVATNGVRVSTTSLGGGRKIEHWQHRYPIVTYLVALCVADYDMNVSSWSLDGDTIPFLCYSLPGNTAAMSAFQTYGPQSLTILSDLFGTYPFITEKMGHADFGWTGAMEHQTFCMYSTDFHTDWVIAHESSHQWWGDMITCRTFNHIWINEGFASYSEALFMEATAGTNAYHNYMQTMKYLGPGSIFVENLTYAEIYDGNLSYNKAGWVLHMLRGVLGDSLFLAGVRAFANSEFRHGTANTQDFIDVVSPAVGQDISWFINEWIYGEGNPYYDLGYECRPHGLGDYQLTFFIEQVQTYPTLFKMPIRLRLTTTAGVRDTVVWNEGKFMLYQMTLADSLLNFQLDPQQWILRDWKAVPLGVKVITQTLPDGYLGEPYAVSLAAVGGTAPYHWRFFGGDLPFGTEFDTATATVFGTPSYVAPFYFTLICEDSSIPAIADTVSLSITILPPPAVCGDADGSQAVNISDAVFLINYIFAGGPAPDPLTAGDVDCSGLVTISDAVYLINYIFSGGPQPCAGCP